MLRVPEINQVQNVQTIKEAQGKADAGYRPQTVDPNSVSTQSIAPMDRSQIVNVEISEKKSIPLGNKIIYAGIGSCIISPCCPGVGFALPIAAGAIGPNSRIPKDDPGYSEALMWVYSGLTLGLGGGLVAQSPNIVNVEDRIRSVAGFTGAIGMFGVGMAGFHALSVKTRVSFVTYIKGEHDMTEPLGIWPSLENHFNESESDGFLDDLINFFNKNFKAAQDKKAQ
jgi:hypothetical protein